VSVTLLYTDSGSVVPAKGGNPEQEDWIPGQARNAERRKVIYKTPHLVEQCLKFRILLNEMY